MALLAPTFNRLNIVKRLKKWNHQTYSPFPSPFPYSNFLLTSRLSISSDHSVSRNYRQLDPSGVLPPLPERTRTFGIYLTRHRHSHRANIRRGLRRVSPWMPFTGGRHASIYFSLLLSILFSFPFSLFCSFPSLGETSLRRHRTGPLR